MSLQHIYPRKVRTPPNNPSDRLTDVYPLQKACMAIPFLY